MTNIVFEREPGARRDPPTFTMPKPIGRMMVALALLTIAVAGTSRLLGVHAAIQPLAPVVAARDLIARDRPDLGVTIFDARTGQLLTDIATEDSARFLRTMIRGLGVHVDPRTAKMDAQFTLTMRQDGQLTISRKGSDRVNSLNGFGLTQVATLQAILVKH